MLFPTRRLQDTPGCGGKRRIDSTLAPHDKNQGLKTLGRRLDQFQCRLATGPASCEGPDYQDKFRTDSVIRAGVLGGYREPLDYTQISRMPLRPRTASWF